MSREAKADDDDDDDDDKDKDTVIGGFDSKNFVLHQRLWESGTSVKKPKAEQQLDGSTFAAIVLLVWAFAYVSFSTIPINST